MFSFMIKAGRLNKLLLFLFSPLAKRSFLQTFSFFVMCLGVEAIDYGIDIACFWEEVGSTGNKRGGVEAIHNKCE